jgi:hypothetical protein
MAVDAINALLSLVIGNLHTDKLLNSPRNAPNRSAKSAAIATLRRREQELAVRCVKVVGEESVCPIQWIILVYQSDFLLHNCDKKPENRSFGYRKVNVRPASRRRRRPESAAARGCPRMEYERLRASATEPARKNRRSMREPSVDCRDKPGNDVNI